MGPPVIPEASSRTFTWTARTFRSYPKEALGEAGLRCQNIPNQGGVYSWQGGCTYGNVGLGYKVRPDFQEQSNQGTSPGVPALPRCRHGCSWEVVLSDTCSLSEVHGHLGKRKLHVCPKGWAVSTGALVRSLGTAKPALAPAGLLSLHFQEALELASAWEPLKAFEETERTSVLG